METSTTGVELGIQKPENLLWIENIILTNLEVSKSEVDPASATSSQSQTQRVNAGSKTNLFKVPSSKQRHDIRLQIAEIEMRDENYFGDDRIRTLSRLVSARIKYMVKGDEEDEARNQYWIIKIPSMLPQERDISKIFDSHRREITFYTEILPSMRMWVEAQDLDEELLFKVPPCYYGRFLRPNDLEPDFELLDHILDAESILVLDDLRASDFGKRHFSKSMALSEVYAAITEICKFHAVSHAMQTKSNGPFQWKELLRWQDFCTFYEHLFRRGFEVFKNFLSNRPEEQDGRKILQCIENLNQNIHDVLHRLMRPLPDFPTTLIHLDLWSDNLLFRVQDGDENVPLEEADLDCAIIDWQMVSLGRPSHDLALLTMLSLDCEPRRDICHNALQYYYQLFEKILGNFNLEIPFTFDRLIVEFSNSCLLAVIMAIASMDLILLEETVQIRLLEAIKDLMDEGILTVDTYSIS